MKVYAIGKPYPEGRVLLWRADSKTWEIGRFREFERYIGHPELAYQYWLPLPSNPEKAGVVVEEYE